MLAELDRKTRQSARFAVLVLREEYKAEAREHFRTPLVFSIQEAKGLEYENVILYDFVSRRATRFRGHRRGSRRGVDSRASSPTARVRDKGDKSLETCTSSTSTPCTWR